MENEEMNKNELLDSSKGILIFFPKIIPRKCVQI